MCARSAVGAAERARGERDGEPDARGVERAGAAQREDQALPRVPRCAHKLKHQYIRVHTTHTRTRALCLRLRASIVLAIVVSCTSASASTCSPKSTDQVNDSLR